ncbi:MAG: 2Fe-2S iron-sulfur cluster-binding protein, partial [Kiritimatiellia bacterium]|nr:2Fe-2S iron-sulfur cluster-binding protein [Kiritimatiellia bacterium]
MDTLRVQINGLDVDVAPGTSILKAAEKVGVKIPSLCYHPDLPAWAACGICVVKVEGSPKMLRACATPVGPGMKITTHDPEIVAVRRSVLELILSTHPDDCLQCPRNGNCELQKLAGDFGIREVRFEKRLAHIPPDHSTPSIVLNPDKCVKCGRCAIVCQQMQNVWALEFIGRGENTRLAPAADVALNDSPCIKCGQCSAHCPVGAIYENDETGKVWEALANPELHVVVQIAPAVRVAIGEAFGFEPGTVLTGKTYTALRRLGFHAVFDTNFGADLTIL